MGRDSDGLRPSRRRRVELEESVPRAAERRKVRSGRERVEVSSLGMMYCIVIVRFLLAVLFTPRCYLVVVLVYPSYST